MPRIGIKSETSMTTRNKITHVNVEVELRVDGRELPNAEVLGKALEAATELIQTTITESYTVVPARDGATTMADPFSRNIPAA
jgi:hypothetical protein